MKRSTVPRPVSARSNPQFGPRIKKKEKLKLRQLSGWNVFQREKNQGCVRGASEWARHQKVVSKMWRDLPEEDRNAYATQAAYEQNLRERNQAKALPVQKVAETEEITMLGKRWANKTQKRRLQTNQHEFESHEFFKGGLQLLDVFSPLAKEHLESSGSLTLPREFIDAELKSKFYSNAPRLPSDSDDDCSATAVMDSPHDESEKAS